MTMVKLPYVRREVIISIASLADRTHQQRVWIRHELPYQNYYDELALAVHTLFDDTEIFPVPGPADGFTLLPGNERERLRAVGARLDRMIIRLGAIDDARYLADPQWSEVVDLSQRCLTAMILAGGWEHTDTDADTYATERAEGRIPTVELPAARRRVITAVAALADDEYHQRTWVGAEHDSVTGSLTACLRTLDDAGVLPDPVAAVGRILLAGDEIDRLAAVGHALEPFRAHPVAAPWHDPAWHDVVRTARSCLPALVIAGAWIGPDPGEADRTAPAARNP